MYSKRAKPLGQKRDMNRPVNILIADDDQEDLELMEEAILNAEPEAKLHMVSNGKEAVDYLKQAGYGELPCLIVLDYNMPEMTGAEVLAVLEDEAQFRNIPKVILSTSGAPIYMDESKNSGATDYFVKPTTKNELDELAKRMLSLCA